MTKSPLNNHHRIIKNNLVQYDDFGETFGKSRKDMRWSEIDEILELFLQDFSPSSGNIADIGCGNGRLLRHIMEHEKSDIYRNIFTTYVGLDTSAVLLNHARTDIELNSFFPSTNWQEGDMRNLSQELSEYGKFDALFFIASFHHLSTFEERLDVLHQSKNLLSETGKIVMINWNLLDPSQEKYQPSQTASYPDGSADFDIKIGQHSRFYHAFSTEEYASLAEKTDLHFTEKFGERNSIFILHK